MFCYYDAEWWSHRVLDVIVVVLTSTWNYFMVDTKHEYMLKELHNHFSHEINEFFVFNGYGKNLKLINYYWSNLIVVRHLLVVWGLVDSEVGLC